MAKAVTFTVVARNSTGHLALATARVLIDEPPVIESVTVDPPVIRAGGQARVTVIARDPEDYQLTFDLSVSEGSIERTAEPHVFIWQAPGGAPADSSTRGIGERAGVYPRES